MPIKVKCSCGQVLNVPDKLAGKSGKCPKCKNDLRIPAGQGGVAGQGGAARKAAAQGASKVRAGGGKSAAQPQNAVMDSLLEDAGLKKQQGPACSNCGSSIRPGALLCTECGFNFETGESLSGFDVKAAEGPEFDNLHLQHAADNMKRELVVEDRRDKAAMPWWVLMSFLIGSITLCAAGVVIVDGKFGTPAAANTFIGKVQRWPVFVTLGLTILTTGVSITVFAHLNICAFAFSKSFLQGFACLILPLIYSIIYGIMSWTNNKAPIKAIMLALGIISLGVFLIIQGGGFQQVIDAFK